MENRSASELILQALEEAPAIQAAGKQSLLAIAGHALAPEAPVTREGIAAALGLHESLLCAILVSADVLGDTLSRRELARVIFPRLPLRGRPPELTAAGELVVVRHCLEAAASIDGILEGLLAELGATIAREAEPAALDALEARAVALQRTKIVPIERDTRSRLGVPTEEVIRRRAAQAVRATVQGLRETGPRPHLTPTVAGELAAAITLAGGIEAAGGFLLSLGEHLDALPPAAAVRRPGN
jgi:hypothetical protein